MSAKVHAREPWSASRHAVGDLLAAAAAAVFGVDDAERLTFYEGASFSLLTGGERLVGRRLDDAFRRAPGLVELVRRARAGAGAAGEERVEGRFYECRCQPQASRGEPPAGVVGCITDVTARRHAEHTFDQQARLFAALDVFVWRADPTSLRLTEIIGAAGALGLRPGEPFTRYVYPDERETTARLLRAVVADGVARTFVHRLVGADGRATWLRTHVAVTAADPHVARELLGVMQDITERVAAESSLRDSESQLRLVLDQLPALVFTTDRDLRFTFGMGAELAELGVTEEGTLGRISVQEYLHIDDPAHPVLDAYRRALAGERVSFETEWVGRWYQTYVEPFHDAAGQTIGTLAVSWNVTERKRAEQGLRLLAEASAALAESLDYRETLNKVAEIAVPVVADWCLVAVLEDHVLRIVAAAHVQPDKRAIFDELPERSLDLLGDAGRVVRGGRALLIDEVVEDAIAPGGPLPLPPEPLGTRVADVFRRVGLRSIMVVPLAARGQTLGALVLARAVPGRRYAAADLRLAETLGRRCAVAIDNARLYREAQQAIELREDFLSVASHELRTPLTSMLLRLDSLERDARTPGGATASALALASLARQARRLSELVDELLDVSRIRLGRLALQRRPFDLVELAREVVSRLEADAARVGCSVSLCAPAPVVGAWDPLRLDQVVTNLLSNAVKYAGSPTIDVRVEALDGEARLVVHDGGVGIPPEDQERIFERFERRAGPESESARRSAGLGLGLYITRQIVEAHGGRIRVSSAPGQGTTFVVELPRSAGDPDP